MRIEIQKQKKFSSILHLPNFHFQPTGPANGSADLIEDLCILSDQLKDEDIILHIKFLLQGCEIGLS